MSQCLEDGNTPACAGKSRRSFSSSHCMMEIPPRARGRDHVSDQGYCLHGNTPACAGKSASHRPDTPATRKYPRVRGEESSSGSGNLIRWEIPPRARGRGACDASRQQWTGNTPACAGKRSRTARPRQRVRKYPRVRGEERCPVYGDDLSAEIPPRARGRESLIFRHLCTYGNTPACAGKSCASGNRLPTSRKYPRVRGEEQFRRSSREARLEIPPRARGRVGSHVFRPVCLGNTPACAGKSVAQGESFTGFRKYPRVRGEEWTRPG